ncbi:MAG: DUF2848 family protein [Rhodospirillales bacterium]|jgi:hypothetical protein|nr:DUF2848 family protein [Rhodospirillales bacterium]
MKFRVHENGQINEVEVAVREVIIAGMTGRDVEAVQKHIDELAELGVDPPSTIPIYYRVSAGLLTQAQRIEVVGSDSSGEVEAVLIGTNEGMLVAVGSDHTDRKVEADSIAISKQMCPKPISVDVWRYADVVDGWDGIQLVSDKIDGGEWTPYQRGSMGKVRKPEDLIGGFFNGLSELPAGVVMYTGTIETLVEIGGADQFAMALVDPKNGRTLSYVYDAAILPNVA